MTVARAYRFFRVIGYRTRLDSARNAVRYAAFRSEAVKEKAALIFDARTDSADVRSFLRSLDDPITRHPAAAKAYHSLFSLPRIAYDQAGVHWPDVVREALRDYELQTHRRLHWIAVVHDDPKHPHAHVIIKATYQDERGRTRRLFVRKPELERIKESVGRALEARGLEQEHLKPSQPLERAAAPRIVGSALSWIQERVRASRQRQQHEEARSLREWELRQRKDDRGR